MQEASSCSKWRSVGEVIFWIVFVHSSVRLVISFVHRNAFYNLTDENISEACSSRSKTAECDAILIDSTSDDPLYSNCAWLAVYVALLVLVCYVIYSFVYQPFWKPIRYCKELTEVGFEHIPGGVDKQLRIARAQATRRLGSRIPPPYPNGWFAVAESCELKVGGVLAVDALGQNLCVYRGEDGQARVVDAYCPHLGANLGVGGSVSGNCIECPFHLWRFNEEGTCVHIPQGEAPRGVSIKTWTCVEADGAVWIWHDAEKRAPQWELTNAPQCDVWTYRGRNEFIVSAHIQEIPENGADVGHLNAVHSSSLIADAAKGFLSEHLGHHVWNATWAANGDHTARMILTHDYRLFGHDFFHVSLNITQNGPGHVRLVMETPIGPFLFSQSVTPLGPLLQRVVHRLYSPFYNAPAAGIMIKSEGKMIERDIRIWNSKRFVASPTYVKTDKAIRAFRTWYSQFYSQNSLSFKDSIQNPLDW